MLITLALILGQRYSIFDSWHMRGSGDQDYDSFPVLVGNKDLWHMRKDT